MLPWYSAGIVCTGTGEAYPPVEDLLVFAKACSRLRNRRADRGCLICNVMRRCCSLGVVSNNSVADCNIAFASDEAQP